MATDPLPEADTQLGRRVRQRLRDEALIWFTSVGRDGTPQPNPVWFIWRDGAVLVYNLTDAHRLTHIRTRPLVSLHFDSNGQGGDVIVLRGHAERVHDQPPPHEQPAYLEKYREGMTQVSGSPESFGRQFPVPVLVEISHVRGF